MGRFSSKSPPPLTMPILIWSSPPAFGRSLATFWGSFLLSLVSKEVSSEGSVTGGRLGRNSTGDLCPRPP